MRERETEKVREREINFGIKRRVRDREREM